MAVSLRGRVGLAILFRRQAALLRRAAAFRLLFAATFASGVGTWLAFVALTVDVFDRTGSAKWVAALLIAEFVPTIVVGLALGPLVDRLSRKRLMIGSDVVRAAVFCALPFVGSAAAVVALALVAGIATAFFRPAVYAGLPNLVGEDDLPNANSLLQFVDALTNMVGPVAGGLLVAASSPDVAYWINAVTFLVSAAFVGGISSKLLQAAAAASKGHLSDLAAGFRLVRDSRPLLTVLLAWNVASIGIAGINVSEIVLAKEVFDAGDFGFGLLLGTAGVGLAIGSFVAGVIVDRFRVPVAYGGGLAMIAIATGVAAVAPNVWVAAAVVVVSGFGNGLTLVCNTLLVQRGAPDELRGRAFTVLMGSNFAVIGLAMVAAGPLTDAVGARWVWGGAAIAVAVAGVVGAALAAGADRETVGAEPEPAL
jgi:MFS family permease